MADKIATRQAYGEALIELVEKNDKVVVLDADPLTVDVDAIRDIAVLAPYKRGGEIPRC